MESARFASAKAAHIHQRMMHSADDLQSGLAVRYQPGSTLLAPFDADNFGEIKGGTMRRIGRWSIAILLGLAIGARADSLRILDENREAWGARLNLIRSAERTIDAAYFTAHEDPVALALFAALRDAARRGVRIRLIVDGLRDPIPACVRRHLLAEGIEIRVYHPFWRGKFLSRLHDKLLIRDGEELITGGRNIGAEYFGLGKKKNYCDRDALVHGSAAAEAACYFQSLWDSHHVRPISAWPWEQRPATVSPGTPCPQLDAAAFLMAQEERLAPYVRPPEPVPLAAGSIRFLHAAWIGCGSHKGIAEEILSLIDVSQDEIVIQSPYVHLSPRFRRAIASAIERGVHVRLITNSLRSTDVLLAHAGYTNQKRFLQKLGVDIREAPGPSCLHAKTMIVDNHVIVGSYNLNARSECRDTEVAIVVTDAGLAQDLKLLLAFEPAVAPAEPSGPWSGRFGSMLRCMHLQWLRLLALPLQNHL